jgi:hypothetical protein
MQFDVENLMKIKASYGKSNKMPQCFKILFHIYIKLNMFRATHHPSSGVYTLSLTASSNYTSQLPTTHAKPEAASAVSGS